MPFSPTHRVLYGEDSLRAALWARTTFCSWLAGRLNDPLGRYAAGLDVSPDRQVLVSDNIARVRLVAAIAAGPPTVAVRQGPVATRPAGKRIDGVTQHGARYDLTLHLDMGVADSAPATDNLAEAAEDALLAGAVLHAIRSGFSALELEGLNNVAVAAGAEAQRAPDGRHPHSVSFFLIALDDWVPT